MISAFSPCSSGMRRSTESTSETLGRRSKACCLRRSSSRLPAEARALKPERPVEEMMRFSHATDSVPLACRFRRL
jgi:hypothetical protein